jgi:hypothetical protein
VGWLISYLVRASIEHADAAQIRANNPTSFSYKLIFLEGSPACDHTVRDIAKGKDKKG